MAGKKRIKRRTYKKIIAKAMALSMCISIFYPGGTGIVAYAAEETNNSIVHSWDFEDGMQDWEISGWESAIFSTISAIYPASVCADFKNFRLAGIL